MVKLLLIVNGLIVFSSLSLQTLQAGKDPSDTKGKSPPKTLNIVGPCDFENIDPTTIESIRMTYEEMASDQRKKTKKTLEKELKVLEGKIKKLSKKGKDATRQDINALELLKTQLEALDQIEEEIKRIKLSQESRVFNSLLSEKELNDIR